MMPAWNGTADSHNPTIGPAGGAEQAPEVESSNTASEPLRERTARIFATPGEPNQVTETSPPARYCSASATCISSMTTAPPRSAMVLATRRTRS